MKTQLIIIMFFILNAVLFSCKKPEGCTDPRALNYDSDAVVYDGSCEYGYIYSIPATYNFENVNYSGQTARLQLLDALVDKIGEATNTNPVTAQELIQIYENTNGLFGSTKDLASKTYILDQQMFYDWFQDLEDASANGTGIELEGRYYTSDGIEIKQMVEKGLMGAVFYYQAASYYLENLSSKDNSTVEPGEGTEMQHNFDEAFGYFGAPIDYATNDAVKGEFTTTSWYWAKYGIDRNTQLNNKSTLFTAFITCRAAIVAGDYTTRDAQITVIKENWELINAANVIHYINEVTSDISANDTSGLYHHWAEGKGFVYSLKYNVDRKISDAQLTTIHDAFGSKPTDASTVSQFNVALQSLKDIYGFTDSQMLGF